MRTLAKNRQKLYYAEIIEGDYNTDEHGNMRPERSKSYSEIKELWINVSPANGQEAVHIFGILPDYTKILCTTDTALPFSEDSDNVTVFWVDREPSNNEGVFDHNYQLHRVAKSLNSVLIAIKRVESGGKK